EKYIWWDELAQAPMTEHAKTDVAERACSWPISVFLTKRYDVPYNCKKSHDSGFAGRKRRL
ncbi:MAG: hypothetical protein M3Z08_17530, partial [Chloroflexota bacterium]|nr:hypothetical protein [Chloroflexota bacterium]